MLPFRACFHNRCVSCPLALMFDRRAKECDANHGHCACRVRMVWPSPARRRASSARGSRYPAPRPRPSVIYITQSVSFRRHNSRTWTPGAGMKQARESRAALCVFVNLKAWAIQKGRGKWQLDPLVRSMTRTFDRKTTVAFRRNKSRNSRRRSVRPPRTTHRLRSLQEARMLQRIRRMRRGRPPSFLRPGRRST